jgi:hypothetical protein
MSVLLDATTDRELTPSLTSIAANFDHLVIWEVWSIAGKALVLLRGGNNVPVAL